MIWVVAIALALASFGIGVLVFRLPMMTWTSFLAALALGLAGFALQATPGVPGAPKPPGSDHKGDKWQVVESRKILVGPNLKSDNPLMITADAYAHRGKFRDAADLLEGIVAKNPKDFDAWVALGNALTEQADGILTPAAIYAFTEAQNLDPQNPAPGYFLGLSLIRQQRVMQARQVWQETLNSTAQGTNAHAFLAQRLDRLDQMLSAMGALQQPAGNSSP